MSVEKTKKGTQKKQRVADLIHALRNQIEKTVK